MLLFWLIMDKNTYIQLDRCEHCHHAKWSNESCRNTFCGESISFRTKDTRQPKQVNQIDYLDKMSKNPVAKAVFDDIKDRFPVETAAKLAVNLTCGYSHRYMKAFGIKLKEFKYLRDKHGITK